MTWCESPLLTLRSISHSGAALRDWERLFKSLAFYPLSWVRLLFLIASAFFDAIRRAEKAGVPKHDKHKRALWEDTHGTPMATPSTCSATALIACPASVLDNWHRELTTVSASLLSSIAVRHR